MTSVELVTADAILLPVGTIEDGKAQMQRFQEECAAVLAPSDWQGPPGQKGSFVKKSGWRKLAMRYAISCRLTGRTVERDEHGNPVRAEATVLAVHKATGQEQEADGYCAASEPRFRRESGRYKLENDLRNTATTRAKNRAISDLIGYGQVDADNAEATVPNPHEHGPPATNSDQDGLLRALDALGVNIKAGDSIVRAAGGYLPRIAALTAMYMAANKSTARPDEPAPAEADRDMDTPKDATQDGEEPPPEQENNEGVTHPEDPERAP